MHNKVTSAADAVAVIQNGDTLCTSGFVDIGVPDGLLKALEKRYLETAEPRDLTLVFAAGQGDGQDRGLNALGHDGLLKRAIGGHWRLIPKLAVWRSKEESRPTICPKALSRISTETSRPVNPARSRG
jgi:propionate CoA-transferase